MPSLRFRAAVMLVRLSRVIQMESLAPVRYQRWWFDGVVPRLATAIKGVRHGGLEVSGMRAEWAIPEKAAEGRAILYLHGGAYVVGSAGSHRALVSRLARETGCRALSVEYRLAPEHPFPAAVEDAAAAFRWLCSHGHEARHVALAGDSAGGGLAVAAMLSLRDAGGPLPAAAALACGAAVVTTKPARLEWLHPLRDREHLWLVPPGDPEALRSAIATLLADRAARERLRRAARLASGAFDWDEIARRHIELYEAILGRRARV